MAGRRKLKEPIKGIGNNIDTALVQKSNPLLNLWQSELTLSEFKVLDIYLARINSHESDKRLVEISKKELESVFGISRFNVAELDMRLGHLMSRAIRIGDKDYKKGFAWVSLFEEARVDLDDDGVQMVYLECTAKAMKYFFNVERLGYLRYSLRTVINISSRYTYVLFQYLEKHRHMGLRWTVPLEELKIILNCENESLYRDYKRFNERILKRCQKELHEKTECKFEYNAIRRGRSVAEIEFILQPLSTDYVDAVATPKIAEPHELDLTDPENDVETDEERREKICLGFNEQEFEPFSDDELKLLKSIAWSKKSSATVDRLTPDVGLESACQYAVAEYLRQQIQMAKVRKANNLFSYVKKMIENEKESQ